MTRLFDLLGSLLGLNHDLFHLALEREVKGVRRNGFFGRRPCQHDPARGARRQIGLKQCPESVRQKKRLKNPVGIKAEVPLTFVKRN